jgi:hypothetical protein
MTKTPENPVAGGSYVRDPVTGALTPEPVAAPAVEPEPAPRAPAKEPRK